MKKTLQDIENWRKVINAIKQDNSEEGAFKLDDLKCKESGDKPEHQFDSHVLASPYHEDQTPTIDDRYFESLLFTYEAMRDFLYEMHSFGDLNGYAYEEVFELIEELDEMDRYKYKE
ncbi:hypothetical protein 000TH008_225 [Bacillus phage 000TH008]|nr:hypothetical protein 000TH008_225 [Bacillus phage 000TH008]QQO40918.1 hypothetical protein 000TH009_225 [Bacillus phage 000TH009]